MFTHVLLIERAMAEILTPATQPLWQAAAATQPLSRSGKSDWTSHSATQPV